MPAKIFVSCGQASEEERRTAAMVARLLTADGFETYVAIDAQSIEDVNTGIIGHLRRSDYYVFIDFAREEVDRGRRGSVFTHQELAIAYVLGFQNVLFFQQEGVALEGLLRYMGSNASRFVPDSDLPQAVLDAANVVTGLRRIPGTLW